jgi:hypothetical protein
MKLDSILHRATAELFEAQLDAAKRMGCEIKSG